MSVLIKGMDMPKNCKKGNCLFRGIGGCVSGRYEEVWCHAANNRVEWEVVSDERSKDCPLIEVKTPHGDLIDVSKISSTVGYYTLASGKTLEKHFYEVEYIQNAPIVIESEE